MTSMIGTNTVECSKFLNLALRGKKIPVERVAALNFEGEYAKKFVTHIDEQIVSFLNANSKNFIIASKEYEKKLSVPHVLSENPRLDFCRAARKFFVRKVAAKIEKSAQISDESTIGHDVSIGHNVVIERNVSIGNNTQIKHNVVIGENSRIGSNCLIKSGTIIGQKGFGFERDADGVPVEFSHFGSVLIGNFVELGALNTVAAGALEDTIIEDFVKTDDHVHIAHNSLIGEKALVAACAEISGSVMIGSQTWIGPNSSIIDKSSLGNQCFVGIGAVVTKSYESRSVVAGNPAKILRTSTN